MPFVSFLRDGQLSEKPWKADAVMRLIASVAVCVLIGGLIASVIYYFGGPEKEHPVYFLVVSAGTFGLLVSALIILGRPWPFERFIRNLVLLLACVYGSFFLM